MIEFKLFLLLGMHIGSVDCLVDSGTTHTILKYKDYFINITPKVTSLTTISGPLTLVARFGKAQFMLLNGTVLTIYESLYCPNFSRNLLSFKDIRENMVHLKKCSREWN